MAWIYEEDFLKVIAITGDRPWRLNGNGRGQFYVRIGIEGLSPARIIMGNEPRTSIRFHDKNPCNLRSNNLYVSFGRGACSQKRRKKPKASTTATPATPKPLKAPLTELKIPADAPTLH